MIEIRLIKEEKEDLVDFFTVCRTVFFLSVAPTDGNPNNVTNKCTTGLVCSIPSSMMELPNSSKIKDHASVLFCPI